MLVKTGAASTIAKSIIKALGEKYIYLALALSALLLTAMGVFIDVAVITIAPIAIIMGSKLRLPKFKLLLAMIGGGKCGNILSPNPNTIVAADNFDAPLSSVMAAGIVPALIGLVVTVFVIIPLMPKGELMEGNMAQGEDEQLPALWRSLLGPIITIALLALRPIAKIEIDPMIALPVGGFVGILATGNWKNMGTAKYSKSSWTDKSVVSGVTYKYTVRTVSGKSLSSYTASASLKYLSVPQLTKAFKTADGIIVSYQSVVGADGYRIYRKTADTSWVQIAEVSGNANVDYTDKTAEATVEYIYTVRAYSGKFLSSYNKNGITVK